MLVVEPLRAQAADEADRLLDEADDEDDESAALGRLPRPDAAAERADAGDRIVILFVVYLMEVKPG